MLASFSRCCDPMVLARHLWIVCDPLSLLVAKSVVSALTPERLLHVVPLSSEVFGNIACQLSHNVLASGEQLPAKQRVAVGKPGNFICHRLYSEDAPQQTQPDSLQPTLDRIPSSPDFYRKLTDAARILYLLEKHGQKTSFQFLELHNETFPERANSKTQIKKALLMLRRRGYVKVVAAKPNSMYQVTPHGRSFLIALVAVTPEMRSISL